MPPNHEPQAATNSAPSTADGRLTPTQFAVDSRLPENIVAAKASLEVEQALESASAQHLAVIPIGGRTMLGLGMPPRRYDVALDLSGINQIVDYEPNDFTISVGAGTTLAQLQRTLAEHGQFVPLDAPHFERATVGGVAAVGRGGLRRTAFGGPRDWLIGMRMVRADGQQIKGGGQVVKNVSGYDLPKLFAGSMGTLGAIVEVTLKLRPLPAADHVITIGAPSFGDALTAAFAAAQAAPSLNGCVALSAQSAAHARALGAEGMTDQPTVILRASGLESAVAEVLTDAMAAARVSGLQGAHRTTAAIFETWQAIADLELATPPGQMRLRLGVRPASLAAAQHILANRLPSANRWVAAADSGLLFVDAPVADVQEAAITIESLRAELDALGAHLTIESAPTELKSLIDIWGPAGPGGRLMRSIKQQFDPKGILSPGRFVGGI